MSNRMIGFRIAAAVGVLAAAARGADDLDAALAALAARHGAAVAISELGRSAGNRAIPLVRIGAKATAERLPPALLIVAGLDARQIALPTIAVAVIERLLDEHPAVLANSTVHVVPCLNVDGRARAIDSGNRGFDLGGTLTSRDDDRDGRIDEDGPLDVDGDGHVAWMRVFDPPPGTPRTHLVEPDDPRRHRQADPAKGEVASFALLRESVDRDGDGKYGEDAAGGVDLDWNFPHQFDETSARAGRFALSEAESRALVDWMLAHPEIEGVLVLGKGDSLFELPEAGKTDVTKRAPLGLEKDDQPYAVELRRRILAATGQATPAAKAGRDRQHLEGALASFAYAQYGVMSFALDLTRRPQEPAKDPETSDAAAPSTPPHPPLSEEPPAKDDAPGKPGKPDEKNDGGSDAATAELAMLAAAEREGAGFVPFRGFEHPGLGRVEIGGLLDAFALDPPASAHATHAVECAGLVATWLDAMPRLEVRPPHVERLDDSLHRVRITARNDALLPTALAIGTKTKRRGPLAMRLELPRSRVASGALVQTFASVAGSGGEAVAEWLVIGTPGETIRVTLRAPRIPLKTMTLELPTRGPGGDR
jgi:hypothetical protein